MERRLAAFFAADMVGYSRLMAFDEAGTFARQKKHRAELIDPKISEYGGRIVKTTGDGMLVEFHSVVDALRCAVTIQLAMPERESAVPEANRIAYRVGINLGDIIVEGDDIYGDGVNVAARLEALAEPGGICVSRTVVNHVRGKVSSVFEDLGEQSVKNIPDPVHVFRVVPRPEEAGEAVPRHISSKWRNQSVAVTALAVVALLIGTAGIMTWRLWGPDVEAASIANMAFPLPEKPSIAVLPFDNFSGDDAQDYLVDGITENVIAELSRNRSLFVIARNSTAVYKGKPVKVSQVAEDLGVRYVLEGSVQLQEDQVRITAQLVDATQGTHVWAERYDLERKEIFGIQDAIAGTIAATIGGCTGVAQRAEMQRSNRKSAIDFTAYDLFLRGVKHKEKFTKEDNLKAQELFLSSIERDPNSALAFGWLAFVYAMDVYSGGPNSPRFSSIRPLWRRARRSRWTPSWILPIGL